MPYKKHKLLIEIFFFWIFPIFCVTFFFNHFEKTVSSNFALFLILFPAMTMYLVVGVGAGYYKFWYFNTKYSISGVLPTIGLLYTSCLSISSFFGESFLVTQSLVYLAFATLGTSLLGTFIDIFLLGSGLFYLKSRKHPLGSNPIKHAFSYGIIFFGIVGFVNGVGIYIGYDMLIVSKTFESPFLLVAICSPIVALPFILFFTYKYLNLKNHLKRKPRVLKNT